MTFCVSEKNSVITICVTKNKMSIFWMDIHLTLGVGYGTVYVEQQ